MKNTGKIYTSTEKSPIVAQEFAELLPPLGAEQLAVLEADILANGCYAPIIVDENFTVIDGHNRLSICHTHSIPFQMLVFAFADKLEAKQWALDTQKGRRNLTKWDLAQIALKLKPDIEQRAKENQQKYYGNQYENGPSTTLSGVQIEQTDTRKELAEAVGIGQVTMGKAMQIDAHAPAAVKDAMDKNELSIHQGYQITRQVQELPPEEQEQVAKEAVELVRAQKSFRKADAAIDERTKLAKIYSRAFEYGIQLEPSEEKVRTWADCARMKLDELASSADEAQTISEYFAEIATLLRENVIPTDWRCAHDGHSGEG